MKMSDLLGKVALVTGAGSGVGRTMACKLAEHGVKLALCDIREEQLKETAELIEGKAGSVIYVKTNIADEEEVNRLFREVSSCYGQLDIVVNCAAIWDAGEVEQIDSTRLNRMLDINLKGSFFICREAFVLMRHNSPEVGGSIVNIASTAGEFGSIRPAAHYAAAKGGVIAMSKSLAREGAKDGIRVNVVSPGPLDTPMSNITSEDQRNQIGERTLLGRIGTADDIANGVLFLASSVSSWITGEVLRVNGGSLL
ncbi:SDR family NAD(P)-dependent oxidoreductase [Paenibacillus eucommiae]|uniref:NAD(P)-dependent dehydrogenase (Short-subunit alcohol dehydrogenase family) n=1 Tax=Paenibacillus eucommiae TaxID=1355755 RepID=A0ABS4J5D2_9BACL|nr:SDR family NAD(P)-dependent oxidoreductase [Paenibacillus eucommiae]MBP1994004.1 NAD(P)-dependent dehydrogenase (short-subunit alcohol dehydrogenase family) [Paenibacillus eucommiae]